jgi:uroporphyrinogen decarboxylase
VGLDWHHDMALARETLGPNVRVQGNVDPLILMGTDDVIREAVADCCRRAGPKGHILNVGHGVVQRTPEENVALFCQLARESAAFFSDARQPALV